MAEPRRCLDGRGEGTGDRSFAVSRQASARAALRERREQAWRKESREAIREDNQFAGSRGSLRDRFRRL
ncbi:type II toxin-antitoxin system CcdA family antitoxin [Spiribacter halobius]|uniref:Uncharacterized protein n=1 Tax=Sediminicurvatus halobius TaxID=2182432 RepID=A0A2U2MXL3_9GAMM|nr:hypothetical protein DEM34_15625 [Spiribacter halobius]